MPSPAAARVRPVVGVVPREGHVAHAEAIKLAQRRQRIFDCVTAFDSHETCDLPLGLGAANAAGGGGEHQFVGMPLNRSINRVNHVQRSSRRAAMLHVPGLNVERKELGSLSAFLHALDVGAIRSWRRAAEIEIIVGHRRGDVVVRVHDDGAPMNCQRALPKCFIARRSRPGLLWFRLRGALRAGGNGDADEYKNKKASQSCAKQSLWSHAKRFITKTFWTEGKLF